MCTERHPRNIFCKIHTRVISLRELRSFWQTTSVALHRASGNDREKFARNREYETTTDKANATELYMTDKKTFEQ